MEKNHNDQHRSFYQDNRRIIKSFVFTVAVLGAIAWANLGLNVFTSGTAISSADVNANFAALEAAILNPKSDIVISNSTSYTLDEALNPNYATIILDTSSGLNIAAYNTTTGVITPPVSGLYEINIVFYETASSDVYIYFCNDAANSPDCEGASKMNSVFTVYKKTSEMPGYHTEKRFLINGNNYRFLHNYSKGPYPTFSSAGGIKIYLKLIR